jgi:hypothetical protein
VLFALLFVVNLILPYTFLYKEIHGLERATLPWGEEISRPLGAASIWRFIGVAATLLSFVFSLYALINRFRRDHRRTTLVMALAAVLYMGSFMEGTLFTLGIYNLVPLGPFGYTAMIVLMGSTLNYETRQRNKHLQAILDRVPAHVYIKDLGGRYMFVNSYFDNMYRGSNATTVGKTPYDLFPKAEADAFLAIDQQVYSTGQALSREEIATRNDESRNYYSIRFPLFDLRGTQTATCGISVDITDRKRTEQLLTESETKFSKVFHANPLALAMATLSDYRFVEVNEVFEKRTGYSRAEIVGHKILEFGFFEDPAKFDEIRQLLLASGHIRNFEVQFGVRHGEKLTCLIAVEPIELSDEACFVLAVMDITDRKRTENALRESEQRYREVFEYTSEGLFSVEVTPDQRFRLVEFNPAQEKMIGISNAQAAGKYSDEYLSKNTLDIVNDQNQQCIAAGKPMSFESALDLPTGRSYFSTTLVPVRDAHGRIHRLIGIVRDMTENRKMVEALRESEEKFSKAFHGSPDSITISRLDDGVLVEVNEAFLAVYGYSRDEVIGRSALPDDLGIWVNADERARLTALVKKNGEVLAEWISFRKKDGKIRYGNISWRLIDIDGAPLLLSITRDMTERKMMEEALRESEAQFRLLAENSTDVITRHTPEGLYLYVSPACTPLLGYTPEELVGRSPYELIHPDDQALLSRALTTVLEQNRAQMENYRIRRKDGTYTWFEAVGRAIRDTKSGNVIEIQTAARDVTERKRAQEREREQEVQLFQASKLAALGTLVSGIAHEINNPNNYIRLNSQNLEELWGDMRSILDEMAARKEDLLIHGIPYATARGLVDDLLKGIEEGSKRIQKLLLNLRDFARGDEGSLNEVVEMNEVVQSGVMIVQNLIQKSTDLFSFQAAPSLPPVRGNYHQLEQVVINLLTNACHALPSRNKKIEIVTIEDPGEWVTLTVTDEGVGIPESNISRVVDPFFTTKRSSGGSGLGLSVSSRIVQNHGGTISFSSEVGKGTVVTVRIPAGPK